MLTREQLYWRAERMRDAASEARFAGCDSATEARDCMAAYEARCDYEEQCILEGAPIEP